VQELCRSGGLLPNRSLYYVKKCGVLPVDSNKRTPRPLGDTDLAWVLLAVLGNSSRHGHSGEVDHLRRLRALIYIRN